MCYGENPGEFIVGLLDVSGIEIKGSWARLMSGSLQTLACSKKSRLANYQNDM